MPPARPTGRKAQRGRRYPYPPLFDAGVNSVNARPPFNWWYGLLPQPCLLAPPPFMVGSPYVLPASTMGLHSDLATWLPAINLLASTPPPTVPVSLSPMPTPATAAPDTQISYDDTSVALQDVSSSTSLQSREDWDQQDKDPEIDAFAQQRSKPPKTLKPWDEMYQRLLDYKNKHGNCLVPTHYKADPKLGRWVTNQRHRRDPLSEERKERLNAIGFVWRVKHQESWEAMFERLLNYKAKHGDCLVPQKYKEDPRLGEWVQTQRRERTRCGKLVFAERRAKLDAIGFEWCPHQLVWEHMFERLIAYKEKHGNCLVPRHHHEDPKLGRWVDQQRVRSKKGTIPPKRKEQLDAIGFAWSRM